MKEQISLKSESEKEPNMEVIGPDDWQQLRDLWIEALTSEPQAFGFSMEQIKNRSEEEWKDRMVKFPTVVANIADDLIGMVGTYPKGEDAAGIYGMFIKSVYRKKGIGKKLMLAMLDYLSKGGEFNRAELFVSQNEEDAIEFYKKVGFEIAEVNKGYKMGDGSVCDQYLMRKALM